VQSASVENFQKFGGGGAEQRALRRAAVRNKEQTLADNKIDLQLCEGQPDNSKSKLGRRRDRSCASKHLAVCIHEYGGQDAKEAENELVVPKKSTDKHEQTKSTEKGAKLQGPHEN